MLHPCLETKSVGNKNTSEVFVFFQREKFEGNLIIPRREGGVEHIRVTVNVSAGPSGWLELDVEPFTMPTNKILIIKRLLNEAGKPDIEFGLDCKSQDGKHLTSDSAYLASCRNSWQKGNDYDTMDIKIGTRKAVMTLMKEKAEEQEVLVFWLPGFMCCSRVQIYCEATIGTVDISGSTKQVLQEELTGFMRITSPKNDTTPEWKDKAFRLLHRLRCILSFVRGSPLPVPVTEYYKGEVIEAVFHETGYQALERLAPIHFLLNEEMNKVVSLCEKIDKFSDEKMKVLETAIEVSRTPAYSLKVEFLLQVMAMETLTFVATSPEERSCKTSEKINLAIGNLGVSRDIDNVTIDEDLIRKLTNIRNGIAHEGAVPENSKNRLWELLLIAREITTRLVFSVIGFEGRYQCYVGGRHMREFPSCKREETFLTKD